MNEKRIIKSGNDTKMDHISSQQGKNSQHTLNMSRWFKTVWKIRISTRPFNHCFFNYRYQTRGLELQKKKCLANRSIWHKLKVRRKGWRWPDAAYDVCCDPDHAFSFQFRRPSMSPKTAPKRRHRLDYDKDNLLSEEEIRCNVENSVFC